ncbi:bZIP transcription factor crc [Musca autumnalis]|uniref:bZIP transcription factor crc n=1 Tax=Musca autumnalis TaxID=221902 RepID=UPI003CE90A3D
MTTSSSTDMNNMTTMESLALPQDLYWEGKMEPISPPNGELLPVCEELKEIWLVSDDNFANDMVIFPSQIDFELKHHDVDLVEALPDDEDLIMEFYDLKEENFYSTTPLLDNSLESPVTNPIQAIKVQSPTEINHFSFANHNASVLTQLTPPSSPPQTAASSPIPTSSSPALLETVTAANQIPIGINDVLQQNHLSGSEPTSPVPQTQQFTFANWNNNNSANQKESTTDSSSEDDIEFNTQLIDDILKSAADKYFEDSETQSSISAPSHLEYTDDEWLPSSGSCSPLQQLSVENFSETSSELSSPSPAKKRTRPYGRGVEDRKIRKKEQNKNAATRYRQKKKLEMEQILIEEQELTKRHEELKSMLAERKREAKYLKTLIREFYMKKKI